PAAAGRPHRALGSGVRRRVPAEHAVAGALRTRVQLRGHHGPSDCTGSAAANTRMIYIETPTNPTMRITDISAMAKLANERKTTLVVDNTFLTPYLQRPIELGAHIVVHSLTKYMNGHSDATGGAVILTRPEDAEKIYFIQKSAGAGLAPMDCFLTSRGLKTLAVRMLQHNANGLAVARHLDAHPKVRKVYYPGLA